VDNAHIGGHVRLGLDSAPLDPSAVLPANCVGCGDEPLRPALDPHQRLEIPRLGVATPGVICEVEEAPNASTASIVDIPASIMYASSFLDQLFGMREA
jgi:hypothetical protein